MQLCKVHIKHYVMPINIKKKQANIKLLKSIYLLHFFKVLLYLLTYEREYLFCF